LAYRVFFNKMNQDARARAHPSYVMKGKPMAVIKYSATGVEYFENAEADDAKVSLSVPTVEGLPISDYFKTLIYWGLWNKASANNADKEGDARLYAIPQEAKGMVEDERLNKVASEGGRRGPAYTDQAFVQALVDSGLADNLADAAATFVASVHEEGYRTKAEVGKRIAELCEKYPELGAAYVALTSEGTGGSGKKL
jgi:hypothetical protein